MIKKFKFKLLLYNEWPRNRSLHSIAHALWKKKYSNGTEGNRLKSKKKQKQMGIDFIKLKINVCVSCSAEIKF